MSNALKERILQSAGVSRVPAKLNGIDCHIRVFDERERIEWSIFVQTTYKDLTPQQAAAQGSRAELLARCLCDENGELIFGPGQGPELAALRLNLGPTYDQATVAQGWSEATDESEAKKNSTPAPS